MVSTLWVYVVACTVHFDSIFYGIPCTRKVNSVLSSVEQSTVYEDVLVI
jgi:hypothetical protein